MYIEYKEKEVTGKATRNFWDNFGAKINPGRDYWTFGFLSKGVRRDVEGAYEPKGVPTNLAGAAWDDYFMYVIDDDDGDFDGCVSLETALAWNKQFDCQLLYRNTSESQVTHVAVPDWHSGSVLSTEEYKHALEMAKTDGTVNVEYEVILATMESFETKGYDARLVFWFDN